MQGGSPILGNPYKVGYSWGVAFAYTVIWYSHKGGYTMRAGFTVLLYPLPYYARLWASCGLPLTLLEVSVMNKITELYIVVGGEVMDDMCVQKVTIEQLEKYTVYKISTVLTQVGMIGMLMEQNIYCWDKEGGRWVKLANDTPEAEQERETAKQEQKEKQCDCWLCKLSRKYQEAAEAMSVSEKARMPELEPAKPAKKSRELITRGYDTTDKDTTIEIAKVLGLSYIRVYHEGEGGREYSEVVLRGTPEQHRTFCEKEGYDVSYYTEEEV